MIKSGQVVTLNHVINVLDVFTGSRVSVCLDLYKVLIGICLPDEVVVAGPAVEQEFEVSLDAFFHGVKDAEVRGDRCILSGCVFLAGAEIYALACPKGSALETEEIVVFFAETRFAGRALKDRLCDDGADHLDIVLGSVFHDQRSDALDKFLCIAVGICRDRKSSVIIEVIPCAANTLGSGLHVSGSAKVIPVAGCNTFTTQISEIPSVVVAIT